MPPILRRAVGTVVTITRADGRDDGIYGPIAQAGRMLAAGDLGGAVIVLRNVDGPGAAELVPWLEAAEARLAVDGAMSEMTAQAIAKAGSHDE